MFDFTNPNTDNMQILLLLCFLISCIAFILGWWWARKEQRQKVLIPSSYLSSMNSLLEDHSTEGLQALQNVAHQHPEMLELQMSIGRIYRHQGDISQAIQLHQQLLQEPYFSHEQKQSIIWELALDYHHAGIYNLAQIQYERLIEMQSYHSVSQHMMVCALWALMSLAEQQRQWSIALQYCEKLTYQLHKYFYKQQINTDELERVKLIEQQLSNAYQLKICLSEQDLNCRAIHYWLNDIAELTAAIEKNEVNKINQSNQQHEDLTVYLETKKAKIADGWKWLLQKRYKNHHRIILDYFAEQLKQFQTSESLINQNMKTFIVNWLKQQNQGFLQERQGLIIQIVNKHRLLQWQDKTENELNHIYHLWHTLFDTLNHQLEANELETNNLKSFNIAVFEKMIDIWQKTEEPSIILDKIRVIHYQKPRLTTLNHLLHWKKLVEPQNHDVEVTQKLIYKQLQKQKQHHCQVCGFTSQEFYWYCPSCRQWESYSPYRFDEEI